MLKWNWLLTTSITMASLALGLMLAAAQPTQQSYHQHDNDERQIRESQALITPIHTPPAVANFPLVKTGWTLFNDPALSSNNLVSCASCHDLQTNGAQTTPVTYGVGGAGSRNSLSIFNAPLNYRLFWDGRVNTLDHQLDGPIHNPLEMASSWQEIEKYISASECYEKLFRDSNLPINISNIRLALVEFQRQLLTPASPFDDYLNGDANAIDQEAKRGWIVFQDLGCVHCHQGENIGGSLMQRLGYYPSDHIQDPISQEGDTGRYKFTGRKTDLFLFRVAGLRNVAKTAPYFHDGRTHNLKEAIRMMAQVQLGQRLNDHTVDEISAFLHTLNAPRPHILEILEREQHY